MNYILINKLLYLNKIFQILIHSNFIINIFILTFFFISCNSSKSDLPSFNLEKKDIINLDGDWEFYWLRLYTYEDFKKEKIPIIRYAKIPGLWNDKDTISDRSEYGDYGYATYRLNVKLKKDKLYGIKLLEMFSSYRLFVNGNLLLSNGVVSDDPTEFKPQFLPQLKIFEAETEITEIIIHIANYSYFQGGVSHSILIGTAEQIIKIRDINLAKDLIVFGIILFIGLFHFIFFFNRVKELSLLYFSVGSIFLSIRTSLQSEMFFITLFPNINWEIIIAMQHISSFVAGLSLILFLWSLFENDIKKKFIYAHIIITTSYIILMIFTPAFIYSSVQTPFLIFYMISLLYIFIVLILILKKKRKFSLIMIAGFIVLTASIVNDQLFYLGLINTGYVISFGMMFFIFSQTIILALKFKNAYDDAEKLSNQIIKENIKIEMLNLELEEKVLKRTELISRQKTILDDQIIMAKKIQQTIIPDNSPKINGLDIFFKYKPMMQIGGEFIDFIVKNENEIGLFICDVSGNGVPGAILASMVKMELNHQWRDNLDKPELVLKNIYNSIKSNLGGNFITAIVSYINVESGKFIFSNAGHPPLFYLENNGELKKIQTMGKAIYNYFKPEYEEITIDLKMHDKILMYSDGVIEAMNQENVFYGEEKIKHILLNNKNSNPETICSILFQDIINFSLINNKNNEDITLLMIEYSGKMSSL